jgi:scyllo-inositol 2-dehydrogenase (NADP+)
MQRSTWFFLQNKARLPINSTLKTYFTGSLKVKILKVGIIGQGRSGRDIHGDYLSQDKRFKIAAAVDKLADRRQRAKREYGCDVYSDYREMLKRTDLDLIINATFSHRHVPITLEVLKAGFNILCEKPLAKRVKDVDRLVAESKKSRRVLAVYQQSRYAPYFQQVKKVINSGMLGEIVQISCRFNNFGRRWDWQTLKEYNGGNLMNTGPHPLDQVLELFGEGMPTVNCYMARTKEGTFGNAENHVKVILSGRKHPLIDLEVSSCCAYPPFTYNVYGTKGGLTATQTSAEWKYFSPKQAPEQKLIKQPLQKKDGSPSYPVEKLRWYTKSWPTKKSGSKRNGYSASAAPAQGGMTGKFYNMLYKTLTKSTPLEISLEEIRRQVAVIEKCHQQNPHIYRKRK